MLNRTQAVDEARKQKAALERIGRWRRWLFNLSGALFALAIIGLRQSGWLFGLGAAAAAAAAVSCLAMFAVDLSIRNGRRNVERILDSLETPKHEKELAS